MIKRVFIFLSLLFPIVAHGTIYKNEPGFEFPDQALEECINSDVAISYIVENGQIKNMKILSITSEELYLSLFKKWWKKKAEWRNEKGIRWSEDTEHGKVETTTIRFRPCDYP